MGTIALIFLGLGAGLVTSRGSAGHGRRTGWAQR
jgi:hypothetical protein